MTEKKFNDYEDWLAAAKAAHPAARHNKQGLPGWVHGYGEANDEEFVTGPDMQADVVAVWVADDGFGWVLAAPTTAADMKSDELVYFDVVSYNVFTRKRGATVHHMAASGRLMQAQVGRAAALHLGAGTVLITPLQERPAGFVVVLTDEQVESV